MATPVTTRRRGQASEAPVVLPLQPTQTYSWFNRAFFYVPRFMRHLRRRLKSHMRLGEAWHSARVRMLDYR